MPELIFSPEQPKAEVMAAVEQYLGELSLSIAEKDDQRPWGGFFVIAKDSEAKFLDKFFPDLEHDEVYKFGTEISPKLLVVAPNQELSFQYHDRRAEIWVIEQGPVGIVRSTTDELTPVTWLEAGELVQHDAGMRHRLVGGQNYGLVAEIWQHTVEGNPSNEDDIVRLQDNYGR